MGPASCLKHYDYQKTTIKGNTAAGFFLRRVLELNILYHSIYVIHSAKLPEERRVFGDIGHGSLGSAKAFGRRCLATCGRRQLKMEV